MYALGQISVLKTWLDNEKSVDKFLFHYFKGFVIQEIMNTVYNTDSGLNSK